MESRQSVEVMSNSTFDGGFGDKAVPHLGIVIGATIPTVSSGVDVQPKFYKV